LQHFEISKEINANSAFGNFKMSPRCHGTSNRKFKIEHAGTNAMVQSTFLPSLISTEVTFNISKQFEHVREGFSMKTVIFHNMAVKA
jgi:hypothetical protein